MVPESSATLSKPTATCGTMKPKQMANKSTDAIPKACFFKYSNIRIIAPSIVSFSSAFFLVSNPPSSLYGSTFPEAFSNVSA